MDGTKNVIEIEHDGADVAIGFEPRDGLSPQKRWISPQDAWTLGLLLTSEAPPNALNFDTDWISLQLENHPHKIAWLSMTGVRGGQTRRLTACLKDDALASVGAALLELSAPIPSGKVPTRRMIRRMVSHFYMDRRCERSPAA